MTHLLEEELGDPDQAATHPHLGACEKCRGAVADQLLVRERLQALPDPGAMPGPVALAIDVALRDAAVGHTTSGPTIVPGAGAGPAQFGPSPRRSRPGLRPILLAAAAAVIVVGAGGALLARQAPSPLGAATSGGVAERPLTARSESGAAPLPAHVLASGTGYTRANVVRLAGQLAQLAGAGATAAGSAGPPTGPLATAAGLAGCLQALGTTAQPLAVDLASYDGRPAAVLVLPLASGGREVWVVARDCRPGADGTMFYSRLP